MRDPRPFGRSPGTVTAGSGVAAAVLAGGTDLGERLRGVLHLRAELSELLWLAHLGITLFWVHDRSPGQHRTRALIDGVVPLLVRVLRVSRLPAVRSVVGDAVALVRAVRP